MAWDDTRSLIIAACGTCLEPHGYKLVKSRDAFEKSSASERRGVYILLVASKHGNHKLRVWCGVRNSAIEDRFHKTSGVDKKYRASYTTINLGGDDHWYLNSEQEIKNAITNGEHFVLETAIPFLEREFSYQNYCDLLNSDPAGPCAYHRNAQNRCHYGLIAAKFASDPRYEELKRIYAAYLRSTNNGFYYPRFEKLVTDLES